MKKKAKPTFLDKLVRFAALILAVTLVFGILAGRIDPRDWKYIPFFGLAYPFILLLNILMILWWLFRKRWVFAAGTLILILTGWATLHATFGLTGEAGAGTKVNPESIRLMTYNVHNFRPYGPGNEDSVRRQMLLLIEKEQPDIICFQEYFTRKKGPYDMNDSLKRVLKTPYFYVKPTAKNDYESYGLAIFSRYPIKDKGHIIFDQDIHGNTSIYVDVQIRNKKVRIYNVHLQSISFQKQDYNYIDKVAQKMDADIVPSKRIVSMLRSAFLKRSGQVDVMKKHMVTCRTPFVVAGDFNDTPASYAVTQMTRSLNNAFVEQGTGMSRTYNGKFPNFQIDYITTTKDFKVLNYRVIEAKLSDHFPVRSDLKLNP
jgi:endonuclease/exonuclease/phosphatase family metal-dependent hydrolase